MKSKFFIFSISLLLLISFTSAINISDCNFLEEYKQEAIGQEILKKAPFKDEIIDVYVGEEIFGNLQIEEKKIKDFACVEHEDATYKVMIESYEVLNEFAEADDFFEVYEEKTKSGELEVKGIGIGKKIKLGFVKIALKFF